MKKKMWILSTKLNLSLAIEEKYIYINGLGEFKLIDDLILILGEPEPNQLQFFFRSNFGSNPTQILKPSILAQYFSCLLVSGWWLRLIFDTSHRVSPSN